MLDESAAFSPEAEDPELPGSSEQDLPFWLLPPLAAITFMLLPHALRVLRDSPAGTTGFTRLSQVIFFLFGLFFSLFSSCIAALIICLSFLPRLLSSSTSASPSGWWSDRSRVATFRGGSQFNVETQSM